MRFLDYMKLSSDDEISIFRSLKIDVIEDDEKYKSVINDLSTKYEYIKESLEILNEINKDFKRVYSGKYKYGFCIEEGIQLKLKTSYRKVIYRKYFEVNEKFNDIKKRFENDISFNIN